MLLAKVLDKLFNRRNTFEIESLEGDIVYDGISLKDVVDWVKQVKDNIEYSAEDFTGYLYGKWMLDMLALGSISDFTDNDDNSYFPDLIDQAGKSVVVNSDETGFEYQEPTIEIGYYIFDE